MKKKIVFSLIFWQFRKFRLISTIIFLNYTQVALHWTKLDLSIFIWNVKKNQPVVYRDWTWEDDLVIHNLIC